MSTSGESYAERREFLAAQIARQRSELAAAYRNLEKPLHYAEYGLRGFGFLRKNTWILAAVPALFSIASTAWSFGKKKSPKSLPSQKQKSETPATGWKKSIQTWTNRGWQAYQLYRRVRPFFL